MQRLLAILCLFAGIGMVSAQAQQRVYGSGSTGPYGSSGYGASPYGSASTYGGAQTPYGGSNPTGAGTSFTSPATSDNGTSATTGSSSDYQRVMNAANSGTDDTDPNAVNPPGAADVNGQQTTTGGDASGVATPPSGSGYASPLGSGVTGPTGASGAPGSNGTFTSPSGTTGLGAYNRSPYASGQATAPTSATAAPGPSTPAYTGTNTGQ